MSGPGFNFFDFTGIPTGNPAFSPQPPASQPIGFAGLLDFTGLATSQGSTQAPSGPGAGFCGIIDWTGLCCGMGIGGAVPPRGHGFHGAGRYSALILHMWMMRQWSVKVKARPSLDPLSDLIQQRLKYSEVDKQAEQGRSSSSRAMLSVLLSEI